ncbi:hypothetical protein DFH07DRAFT_857169 [Mycena maculata]|uniref:F-box domain-containing protein n=1 Tax=Mycena maculata TaxID=230809 RepID=A0AAD7HJL2_9AGAR|nr:hypothetical protein DFH07DRAFT_857169 [Mycena maculata]
MSYPGGGTLEHAFLARLSDPTYYPSAAESIQIRAAIHNLAREHEQLEREKQAAIERLSQINLRLPVLETTIADFRRAVCLARPDRIAPEILALVFVFTLPDHLTTVPSEKDAPISVSRVCRHWRQVALATPQLWSTMTIDFSRRPKYDENLWLARNAPSLSCLPAIRILGHPVYRLAAFRSIITPYFHRIRHLEVCASPSQLPWLLGSSVPALQTLVIIYTPYDEIKGPFTVAPNLRCLRISSETWPQESMPQHSLVFSQLRLEIKNLTELHTFGVECNLTEFLGVVSACPSLCVLDLWLVDVEYEEWEHERQDGGIPLHHLRTLSLRADEAAAPIILGDIAAPELFSLHLNFYIITDSVTRWDDTSRLLAQFHSTLQHLTIEDPLTLGYCDLPSFPSLRTLTLLECDSYNPFDWLHTKPSETFLPQLESLRISFPDMGGHWVSCIMHAARFRGPLMRLSLPASGTRALRSITLSNKRRADMGYGVPRKLQRRIAEFAAHGLQFHVDPFEMGLVGEEWVYEYDPYEKTSPWPEDVNC